MKVLTERQYRRREKILATARDLISKHGYVGVTMRELAEKKRSVGERCMVGAWKGVLRALPLVYNMLQLTQRTHNMCNKYQPNS